VFVLIILDRYVLKQFFPIFLAAIFMFVSLVILIDLFANLWRYLNSDVPFLTMIKISLYYIPKSISYALPLSLLFATAYTLGDLYSRNELTAIFSSGIPYRRFVLPFIFLGIVISIFSFFFEDLVVIPTLKEKNFLSRSVLNQNFSQNRSNVVFKTNNSQTIYSVDLYDDKTQSLTGVIIVEQNLDGSFSSLLRAQKADWQNERWEFRNALVYSWVDDILRSHPYDGKIVYNESPDVFKRNAVAIEELPVREALLFIRDLKLSGMPYTTAETDFYHRFSFPVASIVVILLSVAMGGRFRKNILLMSLLTSLGVSVIFYIMEMVTMMMAKLDYIPPLFGAWIPVLSFILLGLFLLRSAKT
jgi:lipopolysaccharide export system permease protein